MERRLFITAYVNHFGITKKTASEIYKANKNNKEFVEKIIKAN